jgi:hypothetical protein
LRWRTCVALQRYARATLAALRDLRSVCFFAATSCNRQGGGPTCSSISDRGAAVKAVQRLGAAVLVGIAAGCAADPASVQPSYVSAVPYESFTCQQLSDEATHIAAALTSASQVQSNARTNDTVAVIFVGLPLASMSGGNVAPQIAQYKGQQIAIDQAASQKQCGVKVAGPPSKG